MFNNFGDKPLGGSAEKRKAWRVGLHAVSSERVDG
jgi:hypothetical protein